MPTASASPMMRTLPRLLGRARRRSPLLLLAAILIAASLAVIAAPRPVAAAPATTTTDLNLRSGPGTTFAVVLVMPSGAAVEVVGGPQNGFYQLTYNGATGWASGDYLDQSGAGDDGGNNGGGDGGTATVTSSLNLRAGPSTGDPVLAVMPAGASVTLTGNSANGFLSVTYNGIAGWAYADFLSTGGSPAPQPNPQPSPSPAPNPGGSGTATVTTGLNLRAGPSTNDAVLAVMPAGATVTLTGNSASGFLSVRYNGIDGWAYADLLSTGGGTPVPAPSPSPAPGGSGTATVTTGLNLRAGPGTNNAVLAVMPAGATVTLTGDSSNGFLSVRYNGIDGWASSDYLNTGGGNPAPSPSPSPSPTPGGTTATTTTALNLRAGPSTGDAILTVMPAGVAVSITGQPQNGFHPISYAGQSGWASSNYLNIGGSNPGPGNPGSNPAPGGGSGIIFPFSGGTWEVIQGYNGGTHQNRSASAQYYYALDLARVDGATAGQAVYAPVSGTIRWNDPGSGGLLIDMGNGYMVAMFHATFLSSLGGGQAVQQGQYIGTISGPGGNGYAVTPHLEIDVWRTSDGGFSRSSVPFTGSNAISGVSFPDIGGGNQHYGTRVYP